MSGLEGLLTGRTLVKRYRIEEVIGRGGFAVVYRAADERLGRTVAVKVITAPAPDAETRAHHQERFEREARAAASLSHPNVVTVHDFGTDPALDIDFLVMEFLHGEDLSTYLSRNGRPPLDLALRILGDAAQGLAVGHRAGLVHRDVKPGNLFLAEPHGEDPFRVCVLDFGIARAAAADHTVTRFTQGGIPLSPAYASPEQARGVRQLTPATDVFSLGVVGYQLLTGEKPYAGERRDDPADWVPARGVREAEAGVPAEVEAVIRRAMSFAPEERYPDAGAMARALEEAVREGAAPPPDATLLQAPPAEAPPPPRFAPPPAAPPARRGRGAAVGGLALLLLAGGVGVWALGGGGGAGEPDGASLPAAREVEGEPVEDPAAEVVAEEPVSSPEPMPATGAAVPPAATGMGADPSSPVATPSLPPAASGGVSRPATSAPPAGSPAESRPPAAQRPAPNPAAPRPAPARADTARAVTTVDTTRPPPRLLGVPTRQPPPAPRDTVARPRSDTATASLPDTAALSASAASSPAPPRGSTPSTPR